MESLSRMRARARAVAVPERPAASPAVAATGALAFIVTLMTMAAAANAAAPEPWQMTLQPAQSPTMDRIAFLHDTVTVLVIAIALFVFGLLVYVGVRFNARRNPIPSTRTHNTKLEIIWTAIPVLILATIAVPSLKQLYYADKAVDADMTVKIIGHQWYWSYEFPDQGDLAFDSFMAYEPETGPRLLEVDNELVLPVGTDIRLLMTSTDVIHAWAVPALGIKLDTVPGRLNETWVRIEEPGVYYGQCSELCGVNHGFMPIKVRAVPQQEYQAWLGEARERFAAAPAPVPAAAPETAADLAEAPADKTQQ